MWCVIFLVFVWVFVELVRGLFFVWVCLGVWVCVYTVSVGVSTCGFASIVLRSTA